MLENPENLSLKQTLKMRRNYVGRSCKLHFEAKPLKIVRASRQYLFDEAGNEYLDCVNNVSHVGHCHPHVVNAGQDQMTRLFTCSGFLNELQVEYAKRLIETLPEDLCVCYFVNSGSEANDMALRLARAYTKNYDVVVIDNAYHGNIESLINISPSRLKRHDFPKQEWVHITPSPDTYRGKFPEDTADPGVLYAQEVKKAILKAQANGRSIAAFIGESLLSQCGIITPPKPYLALTYRYIREAGGVCIADEIQTGLGRTGDNLWAFQSFDVVPDIVTVGKPLGNGYPMAVVVTTRDIADSVKEFNSSFGGNPLACAMGIAVLDVIRDEKLLSSAKSVGKCLIDKFNSILPNHPMMGSVRGMGMVIGVEIVMDKESRKPAKEAAEILSYKLKEQKIILANDGPDKNVMVMVPPMCFTTENALRVVDAFDKALSEIENDAAKVGLTGSGPSSIEVPLSVINPLTNISHVINSDDDEDEGVSPSKRQKIMSYEGPD